MSVKCCLKACEVGQAAAGEAPWLALQRRREARVDVKATETGKAKRGDAISWSQRGCASFHWPCWEMAVAASKRRRASKRYRVNLSAGERRLVKDAAETAEFHHSPTHIAAQAKRVAALLRECRYPVAFTGAGISTSAGIGDYRGLSGKWTEEDRKQRRDTDGKKEEEEEEEGEEEEEDDGVAYELLRPTYTHEALSKLVEMGYVKFIMSQNGDGLHLLSGVPAEKLAELHGNVFLERCPKCHTKYLRPFYTCDDAGSQYLEEMEDFGRSSVKKPRYAAKCATCGLSHATARTCDRSTCRGVHLHDSIINFGDDLWEPVLDAATTHAKRSDMVLVLGTTARVTPADGLVRSGKRGSRLVVCNRQVTAVDELVDQPLGTRRRRKKRKRGTSADENSATSDDGGVRVFGDCDTLMRAVMREMLSATELKAWEAGRTRRLRTYDSARADP